MKKQKPEVTGTSAPQPVSEELEVSPPIDLTDCPSSRPKKHVRWNLPDDVTTADQSQTENQSFSTINVVSKVTKAWFSYRPVCYSVATAVTTGAYENM